MSTRSTPLIICRKCKQELPEEEFYPSMRTNRYPRCKKCFAADTRAYTRSEKGRAAKCRSNERQQSKDGRVHGGKVSKERLILYRQVFDRLVGGWAGS